MSNVLDQFPKETSQIFAGRNAIIFDAECVLCSGFFHFVVRHDQSKEFFFATAQSPLGQACYAALDLPLDDFETNLVIVEGRIFTRMDAVAAVMKVLGGAWTVLSFARFLPGVIKNPLYYLIARNRYRLFGRHETCMIPDPALRARFLPEGVS